MYGNVRRSTVLISFFKLSYFHNICTILNRYLYAPPKIWPLTFLLNWELGQQMVQLLVIMKLKIAQKIVFSDTLNQEKWCKGLYSI